MAAELIAQRYRLLEPLGRGAMSSVWLAEDEELGRRVAVKLLAPSADRARFEREARSAAALQHANICALYDYGESDGKPYMVLEYLPGGSLEERLTGGRPLPDAQTQLIATELAAGLAHAHERGLVHRDLKPANVLFDAEDRAKIADFGIARMGSQGTLTEAGTVLGTASYISPEQASGHPAGPASDVYSFGVILFRMLTGRLPFLSRNAMELVRMHRDDLPPSVADLRADAPANLERITAAALAKDPANRPADGRALLRELRGADGSATMVTAPIVAATGAADATQVLRRPVAAPPPRRRRAALLPLAALALLLLAGGVAFALFSTGGKSSPSATSPTTPGFSLPTVPTVPRTTVATTPSTTAAPTTAPTTTAPTTTTTAARTTVSTPTTTHSAPTTTAPITTVIPPTTTVPLPPPPPPTTTVPPATTTAATTTAATTTATP